MITLLVSAILSVGTVADGPACPRPIFNPNTKPTCPPTVGPPTTDPNPPTSPDPYDPPKVE